MLAVVVIMYAIVGALIGAAVGIWMGEKYWLYGAAVMMTVALVVAVYCYFAPTDGILRGFNSHQVYEGDRLYDIVAGIAEKTHSPMPRVYVCDVDFPNAFANGRTPETAFVAATAPLLDVLDNDQVEGVMAHEMSHIIHRDTIVDGTARNCVTVLTASAVIVGILANTANGILKSVSKRGGLILLLAFIVLAPLIAVGTLLSLTVPGAAILLRFGVSRSREYGADESSGRITGRPLALASALETIETGCSSKSNTYKDVSTSSLWIANPFGKHREDLLMRMLSTHPSLESRIKRLQELDRELNGGNLPSGK